MPGAAIFGKKLHSKGIVLADWRFLNRNSDMVESDCLLGADFYRRIVSPHRLPRYTLGMWLSFTVFGGAMLSGKIPGSTKFPTPNAVNVLSILNVSVAPLGVTTPVRFESCLDDVGSVMIPHVACDGSRVGAATPLGDPRREETLQVGTSHREVAQVNGVAQCRVASRKVPKSVPSFPPIFRMSSSNLRLYCSTLLLVCFASLLFSPNSDFKLCVGGASTFCVLTAPHMLQRATVDFAKPFVPFACIAKLFASSAAIIWHLWFGARFFILLFLLLLIAGLYLLTVHFIVEVCAYSDRGRRCPLVSLWTARCNKAVRRFWRCIPMRSNQQIRLGFPLCSILQL